MVGGGEAMEAVAAEQVSMRSSTDQQSHHVVKGKRTKRQRPQSPIPFVVSTNSTTGDHGGGLDSTNVIHDHKSVNNHANLSPASSSEYMDSTEEDEDMANCLILLAQCQSRDSPKQQQQHQQQQQQQTDDDIAIQNKFNSRRFLEAPSSGNGKAGYYVYECKTCNRTFPSFQALGGHRASHKKPKAGMNNDERRSNFIFASDEEEGNFKNVFQLSHINNHRANLYSSSSNNNNNNKSGKVHECSICGAEFTSGQALGGHMRRHRAPVGTNTTLSLTPMVSSSDEPKKPRNVLSLDLDLNLPAPEDDLRESKPPFASKQQTQQQQQQQQKPALVFSAPTLVDCHY